MQKLFLSLPIALTVACGQLKPNIASTPETGGLTYEASGGISSSRLAELDEARKRSNAGTAAESAPGRSLATIGDFVRMRTAQMNFCYEEALTTNPKLAGAIAVAITITSAGDVTNADVTKRSWSGKGTDEVEACVRARVRTWKFPASDAPTGTYPFSLSFTK